MAIKETLSERIQRAQERRAAKNASFEAAVHRAAENASFGTAVHRNVEEHMRSKSNYTLLCPHRLEKQGVAHDYISLSWDGTASTPAAKVASQLVRGERVYACRCGVALVPQPSSVSDEERAEKVKFVPIHGQTYAYRDGLRDMGGYWNAEDRVWMVPAEREADAKAHIAGPPPVTQLDELLALVKKQGEVIARLERKLMPRVSITGSGITVTKLPTDGFRESSFGQLCHLVKVHTVATDTVNIEWLRLDGTVFFQNSVPADDWADFVRLRDLAPSSSSPITLSKSISAINGPLVFLNKRADGSLWVDDSRVVDTQTRGGGDKLLVNVRLADGRDYLLGMTKQEWEAFSPNVLFRHTDSGITVTKYKNGQISLIDTDGVQHDVVRIVHSVSSESEEVRVAYTYTLKGSSTTFELEQRMTQAQKAVLFADVPAARPLSPTVSWGGCDVWRDDKHCLKLRYAGVTHQVEDVQIQKASDGSSRLQVQYRVPNHGYLAQNLTPEQCAMLKLNVKVNGLEVPMSEVAVEEKKGKIAKVATDVKNAVVDDTADALWRTAALGVVDTVKAGLATGKTAVPKQYREYYTSFVKFVTTTPAGGAALGYAIGILCSSGVPIPGVSPGQRKRLAKELRVGAETTGIYMFLKPMIGFVVSVLFGTIGTVISNLPKVSDEEEARVRVDATSKPSNPIEQVFTEELGKVMSASAKS